MEYSITGQPTARLRFLDMSMQTGPGSLTPNGQSLAMFSFSMVHPSCGPQNPNLLLPYCLWNLNLLHCCMGYSRLCRWRVGMRRLSWEMESQWRYCATTLEQSACQRPLGSMEFWRESMCIIFLSGMKSTRARLRSSWYLLKTTLPIFWQSHCHGTCTTGSWKWWD